MTPALLVIDIQNDYFEAGRLPLDGAGAAAANAAALLARFRARALPVIHVRHESTRTGANFLLPGTPGARIHSSVAPERSEVVIAKDSPNAFRATGLLGLLRKIGVGRLYVAGMMTHMCIDATVRAAFDHGFACTLAHDACATRALQFGGNTIPAAQVHAAFVAALHGVFADAMPSAEVIAGL